jgi:anti-sigma-K factor RskA
VKTNLPELQKKLLAAARANPPSDHVPVAFEQRVLAHLKAQRSVDVSALWARALWRAVVPCVALTVVLLVTSASLTAEVQAESDLAQAFEQTMLAASEQLEETW